APQVSAFQRRLQHSQSTAELRIRERFDFLVGTARSQVCRPHQEACAPPPFTLCAGRDDLRLSSRDARASISHPSNPEVAMRSRAHCRRFLKVAATLMLSVVVFGPRPAAAKVGDRSPDGIWVEVDRSALSDVTAPLPTDFRVYRADLPALKSMLAKALLENLRPPLVASNVIVTLPLPDGTFAPVGVEASPVLGPELAARYPSIRTYSFRGVRDGSLIGRLTETAADFQAFMRPTSDAIR